MAISEGEWSSIRSLLQRMTGGRAEEFMTGKVIKTDKINRNIYMSEFGQQAIPMVANDYEVTYYDTLPNGKTVKKTAKVELIVPTKGDTVLVAREMGTHRLPRCLGKIVGRHWIIA